MPTRLTNVVFDALDHARLARFWADALGWTVTTQEPDGSVVEREAGATTWGDGDAPALTFVPVADPKVAKNRMHLDLVSASGQDQRDIVDRLLGLGATRADIGQRDVPWEVLTDPEGNELCVLEPRDDYEGTRGVAAVVLDCADPHELAAFWTAVTGWPLAAAGEGYVTLRHPDVPATPLELLAVPDPKQGKNRLHLDVAPYPDQELETEVARLEQAGARRLDIGQGDVSWVVLADPEGNELCVLTPR